MTTFYDILLNSDWTTNLKLNFWGIIWDATSTELIKLSVFAFDNLWTPKFTTTLNFWDICNLYNFLNWVSIIRDSTTSSTAKFIEVDSLITLIQESPFNKGLLEAILGGLSSDEKVREIIESLSPEERQIITTNHIEIQRRRVIEELKIRLTWTFSETAWDDSWQTWISNNSWLTWANYICPIEKQKISITGIMPDYLFPTHDWFIDILEIKLPDDEVIKEDPSHPWSWIWSREAVKAIWQLVNYLWEIDKSRLDIEEAIRIKYCRIISLLRPRAYILIWNDDNWYSDIEELETRKIRRDIKLAALRKLNHSLHGIEIITYAELIKRWNSFISNTL